MRFPALTNLTKWQSQPKRALSVFLPLLVLFASLLPIQASASCTAIQDFASAVPSLSSAPQVCQEFMAKMEEIRETIPSSEVQGNGIMAATHNTTIGGVNSAREAQAVAANMDRTAHGVQAQIGNQVNSAISQMQAQQQRLRAVIDQMRQVRIPRQNQSAEAKRAPAIEEAMELRRSGTELQAYLQLKSGGYEAGHVATADDFGNSMTKIFDGVSYGGSDAGGGTSFAAEHTADTGSYKSVGTSGGSDYPQKPAPSTEAYTQEADGNGRTGMMKSDYSSPSQAPTKNLPAQDVAYDRPDTGGGGGGQMTRTNGAPVTQTAALEPTTTRGGNAYTPVPGEESSRVAYRPTDTEYTARGADTPLTRMASADRQAAEIMGTGAEHDSGQRMILAEVGAPVDNTASGVTQQLAESLSARTAELGDALRLAQASPDMGMLSGASQMGSLSDGSAVDTGAAKSGETEKKSTSETAAASKEKTVEERAVAAEASTEQLAADGKNAPAVDAMAKADQVPEQLALSLGVPDSKALSDLQLAMESSAPVNAPLANRENNLGSEQVNDLNLVRAPASLSEIAKENLSPEAESFITDLAATVIEPAKPLAMNRPVSGLRAKLN